MKCYLVRHGQTNSNKEQRWQGLKDEGLSDLGKKQAKKLALYFQDVKVDYIYASDLMRAIQTANPINKELDCRMTLLKKLREVDVGDWEGLTRLEIRLEYGEDVFEGEFNPPNGEGFSEFKERVATTFAQIASKHQKQNIIVVTHGGFIQMLLGQLDNYDLEKYEENKVSNGSVTILEVNKKGTIKLIKHNLIDHL